MGRAWRLRALLAAFALVLVAATTRPALAGKPGGLPEGDIAEIRIEGNASITSEKIRGKIKSRAGRPIDRATIESDLRALEGTKWFSDVRIFYDEAPGGKGIILVIQVVEMPVIDDVQYIGLVQGWGHVKLKDIEEATDLKKGGRADSLKARLGEEKIRILYEEKGFEKAQVKLIEGGKVGDRRIVYQIFEGPKFQIESIDFVGNAFVDDGVLATKIESRRGLFGNLGAKRQKEGLENDKRSLYKYYQDNGFFDVHVSAETKVGKELGREQVVFTISEGAQYKVKEVAFEGNRQIPEAKLREGMMLKAGDPFNETIRDVDYNALMAKYWGIGCIKTVIQKDQPVTDEPGFVRVVYRIEEGTPYILGQLIVKGNQRTKDKVVRREALMAGLLPGEVLDRNRIDIFKRRLGSTGYFGGTPGPAGAPGSKGIDIQIINERAGDKPFGEDVAIEPGVNLTRMQSPDQDPPPAADPPAMPTLEDPPAIPPMDVPPAPRPGARPGTRPGAGPDPAARTRARRRGALRRRGRLRPGAQHRAAAGRGAQRLPLAALAGLPRPQARGDRPHAGPEPAEPEHEQRRPRPQRAVRRPVVCRPRRQRRRGPHRPADVRLRGQQLRRPQRHRGAPRVELRPLRHPSLLGRADQRPGLPRGRAGAADLALAGHADAAIHRQLPRPLPVRPPARPRRLRLRDEPLLSRLLRAEGRRPVLAGLPVRPADLRRRRLPGRGRRHPRLQVPRARRPPRRRRPHHPGHAPPVDPLRQPQQPGLADPGVVRRGGLRAGLGDVSPSPNSPSKASSTSPSAAAPTARASGPSRRGADSGSPAATRRSTSGSSPATTGACEASTTGASAPTSWA